VCSRIPVAEGAELRAPFLSISSGCGAELRAPFLSISSGCSTRSRSPLPLVEEWWQLEQDRRKDHGGEHQGKPREDFQQATKASGTAAAAGRTFLGLSVSHDEQADHRRGEDEDASGACRRDADFQPPVRNHRGLEAFEGRGELRARGSFVGLV